MGALKAIRQYLGARGTAYKERYFKNPLQRPTHSQQAQEYKAAYINIQNLEEAKKGRIGKLFFNFLQMSGILPNTQKLDAIYKSVRNNPNNEGLGDDALGARANHERKANIAMDRVTLFQMLSQGLPQIWASFTQEGFFEGCLTTVKSIASPVIAQRSIGYGLALLGGTELGIVAQVLAGSIGFSFVQSAIDWVLQPLQAIAEKLDGNNRYATGRGLTNTGTGYQGI